MSENSIKWKDPHTGKIYIRKGKCNHCGACCSTCCPYLKIVALRDIKKGESFKGVGEDKGNIIMLCEIFDKPITVNTGCIRGCSLEVRKTFPRSPLVTPECCSFYWVDEDGKKWERKDYSMGVKR